MGRWIKPSASGGDPGGRGTSWNDPELFASFPALTGWLGEGWESDGVTRETGTILIFAEGSQIKCCLSDRQTGLRCFLTARTWLELLQAAEETLYGGDGDWRAPKEKTPHRKS